MKFNSEKALSKWLLAEAAKREEVEFTGIEDRYTPGIPDIAYTLDGISGWIELKFVTAVKNDSVVFSKFTQAQRDFLYRRWKLGGAAWVLVGVKSESYALLIPAGEIQQREIPLSIARKVNSFNEIMTFLRYGR